MHKPVEMEAYDDDFDEDFEEDGDVLSGSWRGLSQPAESKVVFRYIFFVCFVTSTKIR